MDWIWSLFSWEMAGLGVMGVLGIATLVLIARVYRRGLGSYGESHKKMAQRIRSTDSAMREHNHAMPVSEQMQVLQAALRELLVLEGHPRGCSVHREGSELLLDTPQGPWRVRYGMRTSVLRGSRRVVHGAGLWEVCHERQTGHTFTDLALLMRFLRTCLHPGTPVAADEEAAFVERRFR